ncbi:MAG: B12-binding domain-containing radical SAM protein [Candidatus Bathyarchaeales archaeon]
MSPKILLVNPNVPASSPWGLSKMLPPLGLAYVAAALEKAGFEVEVFDNYAFKKDVSYLKSLVEKHQPEMVGIGCNSVTYRQCVEMAKVAKETDHSCKVVVGGPHPSYMPETMLQHPEIDYAVLGEGERAITELAVLAAEKNLDSKAIHKVAGIAYRHDGKIVRNAPKFIENLDEVPYPARKLLPMHLYDRKFDFLGVDPVDTMNVVRGCPYKCAFCENRRLWGDTCRLFSPSRVADEVEHLINNFNTKGIYFVGDNFTINRSWVLKVCELLRKRDLNVEWICDTRVDLVSRELLRAMKHAGCRTIWFGVESGSPRILNKLNKGIALDQVVKAVELCREEGIKIACSFMLGIPGEKLEDMKASLKFAKQINPDWCQFNIFIACPGSNLYDEVVQKGLYDRMDDFLAYVKTEEFNYESLLRIQQRFHKSFHRSPKRVIQRLKGKFLSFQK